MREVQIANTSLTTSRLGLGTSSLHHLPLSALRQRVLNHAWEAGIRYFDTAPLYGHGVAERELGLFASGRRDQLVLATKFGILPSPFLQRRPWAVFPSLVARGVMHRAGRRMLAHSPPRNYGTACLKNTLEQSLRFLHTDYLDLLFLHEPILALLPDAEALVDELQGLKAAGKIRYFGMSGENRAIDEIVRQHSRLAEVLQLDMANETATDTVSAKINPVQITFGHFRNTANNTMCDRAFAERIDRAKTLNPNGVILFSSRKPHHISDLVTRFSDENITGANRHAP